MQMPLEIAFHNLESSRAVQTAVRRRAAALERFYSRLTGCSVKIEAPPRHRRSGASFAVHIRLAVPGSVLVVSHEAGQGHDDLYVALRDAFRAARRQLEDYARLRRGDIKARRTRGAA